MQETNESKWVEVVKEAFFFLSNWGVAKTREWEEWIEKHSWCLGFKINWQLLEEVKRKIMLGECRGCCWRPWGFIKCGFISYAWHAHCVLWALEEEFNNLSSSFFSFRISVSITWMVFGFYMANRKAQGLVLWETHEQDKCHINAVHVWYFPHLVLLPKCSTVQPFKGTV